MIRKVLTTPDKKLRDKSRDLKSSEIQSKKIEDLVNDIYETIKSGEYGVGMSAIQIGEPVAISVVMIRPTPNRPNLENFTKVYYNAKIENVYGEKEPMWEGCCSVLDDESNPIYAKVPRYKRICVRYLDRVGKEHEDVVDGFLAHVLQHEIDHINGIIFTDLVPKSEIVSQDEYRRILGIKK
ncbi:MAG: peptide deformylase [Candidatus Saccharibacteria bacterium]|nr:peptide deformylase [Candidatus Saccharibacteria bacterium]